MGDPSRCTAGTHSYSVPEVNTSGGTERNKAETHLKTYQPNASLGRVTIRRRLLLALIIHALSGLVAKICFGPFDCLLSVTCGRGNACQSFRHPAEKAQTPTKSAAAAFLAGNRAKTGERQGPGGR